MRPSGVVPSRFSWTPWMWSLTLGCIAGSVWSSSSNSANSDSSGAVGAAGPPGSSTSYTRPDKHYHGSQIQHTAPISIYRSPASLRSGHTKAHHFWSSNQVTPQPLPQQLVSREVKLVSFYPSKSPGSSGALDDSVHSH
ncbi:hypothetical protein SRHO_G00138750 [Serrasalmus rhombeus]